MTLKILDCTLRDGGYYNNWDFSRELVSDYLNAMSSLGVTYVELGLRQFKNERYLGAHAYTTAEYLSRLNLPDGLVYGVMIDAKTILSEDLSQEEGIDQLFADCKDEKISLVRVAAHFTEVEFCLPMLDRLKKKGYLVGLNIMQASLRDSDELTELSALIAKWSSVDVLYFADSLGSMMCEDMARVFDAIRKNWTKDIGFHSHNNMGQAVTNVNVAIDLGCSWIDGTVTGMGRGAGNAETEYLLLEPRIRDSEVDLSALFYLIQKHFIEMKQRCGWGVSVPYYIGAINNIHPTYVQELCANRALDQVLIPKIIFDLGNVPKPNAFDRDVLNKVVSKTNANVDEELISGSEIPNFLVGQEVLMVAQTDLSLSYKEAIEDYVAKKKPVLMAINQPLRELNLEYDYVVATHNEKFRADEAKYGFGDHRFIAPKSMFKGLDIDIAFDYGIRVVRDRFDICGTYACVPFRLTLAYAIAFCLEAGASNVNLAGFGGFESGDPRQKEMQDFLKILSKKNLQLHSLTPTSFTISERSIYAI